MTTLTATNGRKYQLDALVNKVEYGEETLAEMTVRLGSAVAAEVKKRVTARESRFSGVFVKETEQAWLFRSDDHGDNWLPKRSTRVLSSDKTTSRVVIAISPSLAARFNGNSAPRNLLTFTTTEVARRLNVDVETVRKWIRDGLLSADSVSDGSAVFEYRIPEQELQRFMQSRGLPVVGVSAPFQQSSKQGTPTIVIVVVAVIAVLIFAAVASFFG